MNLTNGNMFEMTYIFGNWLIFGKWRRSVGNGSVGNGSNGEMT